MTTKWNADKSESWPNQCNICGEADPVFAVPCVLSVSGAPITEYCCAACAEMIDPHACEACGYETDDLYAVPDLDPSVGYDATLLVCQGCIAGTVFHVEHPTQPEQPLWTGVLTAAEVSEIAPF